MSLARWRRFHNSDVRVLMLCPLTSGTALSWNGCGILMANSRRSKLLTYCVHVDASESIDAVTAMFRTHTCSRSPPSASVITAQAFVAPSPRGIAHNAPRTASGPESEYVRGAPPLTRMHNAPRVRPWLHNTISSGDCRCIACDQHVHV